jgi:ABC-type antimicrobial peptide transport system permease subunit
VEKGTIIGVAKDFHTSSLHDPMAPVIIECHPDWTWLYYIRIDGKNTAQTISGLEKIYKQMVPGYSMDYTFQDKQYEYTYRSEQQIQSLVNWFAFFAIFISCLGLFGLTMFTVERKTKEIGIRKVLGASVTSIITLISKQFIALIVIAIIAGAFPAWYFMNDWLQQYAYRVNIQLDVFIMAGSIALFIAFTTIAVLALKAANANPSKSLRTE